MQTQEYCGGCRRYMLFTKPASSPGWGCMLTLMTMGLFLPFWAVMVLMDIARPFRCHVCGGVPCVPPRDPRRVNVFVEGERRVREAVWRSVRDSVVSLPGATATAYRSLPEWATPIVWGLGLSSFAVAAMFAVRAWVR